MPIYVYSRILFHWGYSVRVPGTSGGGPSLPLPPPSTLVGSLAYWLSKRLGWREIMLATLGGGRRRAPAAVSTAYRLARHLLAAGVAAVGEQFAVLYRDRVRYQITQYQSPANLRDPMQWFASINFGLTVAPNLALDVVLVLDDNVSEEGVDENLLEEAAWSQVRLGAREGIVSVLEASVGRAYESSGGQTLLYAPREAFENCLGRLVFEAWDPRDPNGWARGEKPPKPLEICAPTVDSPSPDIYMLRKKRRPLTIRGDWPSYTGDWPLELGPIAALAR